MGRTGSCSSLPQELRNTTRCNWKVFDASRKTLHLMSQCILVHGIEHGRSVLTKWLVLYYGASTTMNDLPYGARARFNSRADLITLLVTLLVCWAFYPAEWCWDCATISALIEVIKLHFSVQDEASRANNLNPGYTSTPGLQHSVAQTPVKRLWRTVDAEPTSCRTAVAELNRTIALGKHQ